MLLEKYIKELLKENVYYNSPDNDYPGNNQVIVFDDNEIYEISGDTHGKESHAIKHLIEFEPEFVAKVANEAISVIQTFNEVYIKNRKGSILKDGENAKRNLNVKSILNTLDFINDKIYNNEELNNSERKLIPFVDKLTNKYDELVTYYISNHDDIDNISDIKTLTKKLKSGKVLKFTGKYREMLFSYYLNTEDSGLLAEFDGSIATLFRIDKKGARLNKVASYFKRGIDLTNKLIIDAMTSLKEHKLLKTLVKDTILRESSEGRKVIAFDFHDTLVNKLEGGHVSPRYEMIEKLKDHYRNFDFVVIYTAAPETDRDLISGQLASLGIPYDVLMMEKPRFDKMYDDRYVGPSDEWV